MPISFTIYEDRGFLLSTWSGVISDPELLSSYKQLFENERYKPGFHEIADLRNAEMSGVTGEGYRRLSMLVENHLKGKCEGFRSAIIADEDYVFGMSRMYEMISGEELEEVMVFREPYEAAKWLGIDDFHIE